MVSSMGCHTRASIALVVCLVVAAHDWPGFHGLQHQGVSPLPTSASDWSRGVSPVWKTRVPGLGFSSPVVLGNRIYLTTAYETSRGTVIKSIVFHANIALGFALLAMIGRLMVHALAREQATGALRWMVCRGVVLFGIILFVLGILLLGEHSFNLSGSSHRSWKLALLVAALCLYAVLMIPSSSPLARWLFSGASTVLSLLAYLSMPKPEQFLNLSSSDGWICTGILLLPPLVAWAVFLWVTFLSRSNPAQATSVSRVPVRTVVGRVAFCSGFSLLLVALLFWALLQRLHRSGDGHVSLGVSVGLPYVVIVAVISLTGLGLGSVFVFRQAHPPASLMKCAVGCAALLAFGSFVAFGSLPGQKQMAHAVVSLETGTGQTRWIREVAYSSNLRDLKENNSRATPTIAASSNLLCVCFGPAGLHGLDENGEVKWSVKGAAFQGDYGVGHSPTVADGVVVLLNDNEVPQHRSAPKSEIAAYSLADGQLLWRHDRPRSEPGSAGFTTPIVRNLLGRKTVLVRGWEDLTAYDLHTGEVRWSHALKHRGHHLVASLVADESRVYLMDATRAMALSLASLAEGRRDPLWSVSLPGEKDSTPVVIDGLLFAATEAGMVACIEVESGKLSWSEKFRERFFASLLAAGNSVLFASESGNVVFVARESTFTPLSQHSFREKIYATPVPLADGILIRTVEQLHFIRPAEGVAQSVEPH